MKYEGTVTKVQRGRDGIMLVVETVMGLRGVVLDADLVTEILADFELTDSEALVGWQVEYDPAHGDLEIIGPAADDAAE